MIGNGNFIYVYDMGDGKTDTIVKEINSNGSLVWSWRAFDYFNYSPFSDIDPQQQEGWAHTISVTRLSNGYTLISLRNLTVDQQGTPVDTILDIVRSPHDPQVIDANFLLAAHQGQPAHSAKKLDRNTENVVWQYDVSDQAEYPMRDVNLLSNGNILITTALRVIEVDPSFDEIVWELELTNSIATGETLTKGFYKAERISS